jgi:hypothetical protein
LATSNNWVDAVQTALEQLILQMIDTNMRLGELHHRFVVQGTYLQGIVDELRTLNSSIGRIEDKTFYPPQ